MSNDSNSPNLVELITNAGPDDLAAIDAQINERKEQVNDLRKEMSSLKELRKIINFRLNGPTKPKATTPKANSGKRGGVGEPSEMARKIHDLLSIEGSMPVPAIAARLKSTPAAVGRCVSASDWFVNTMGEIAVATQ